MNDQENEGLAIFRWVPVPTLFGFVVSILLGFIFPLHTTLAFAVFSLILIAVIRADGYKLPWRNNLLILRLMWLGYGVFFAIRWLIALVGF